MVEIAENYGSNGTRSNPIIIKDDSCQNILGKDKGFETLTDPCPSKPISP
jgi:hypothetical protein